ncbi:hypothetical protein L218DRAFT_943744 [Marasmius fiardii PR-910]|nr:hypothetical protein L218DRAFT_943744 [Marasmius fiardii PR-910]
MQGDDPSIRRNASTIINHIDSLNPGGNDTIQVSFDNNALTRLSGHSGTGAGSVPVPHPPAGGDPIVVNPLAAARRGASVPKAVIAMARAAPSLPASHIAEAGHVIAGQGKDKAKARPTLKFTSMGSSHRQVLVTFDKEHGIPPMNLSMLSVTHLRVESTKLAYEGWLLSMTVVATTAEIEIICDQIREPLPQDQQGNSSFWSRDPASIITAEEIKDQFKSSPLHKDLLVLTGPPQIGSPD